MADNAEKLKKILLQKLKDGDVEKVAAGKRAEVILTSEEAQKFMKSDVKFDPEDEMKMIFEQDEDDKNESSMTFKLKFRVPKKGGNCDGK